MNNIIPADGELLELRQRTRAEIDALQAEIERLTKVKERTRADLRRLFENCLAHLDGIACSHPHPEEKIPPSCHSPAMMKDDMMGRRPAPCSRLLQGIAGNLFTLARTRLAAAGGKPPRSSFWY